MSPSLHLHPINVVVYNDPEKSNLVAGFVLRCFQHLSDPENEVAIQEALAAASKSKTLIVVAHRLQTIINADQIAFVENGQILCSGTHETMLKNCAGYKRLWDISNIGGEDTSC